jgi:hypothetical protein
MLVERLNKQPEAVTRATVDFSQWVDSGETITAVTFPVVSLLPSGWSGPFPWSPPYDPGTPPVDSNPLLVQTSVLLSGNLQVQMFLINGTVGLAYQVQFVATGTSGRQIPIEIDVQVMAP